MSRINQRRPLHWQTSLQTPPSNRTAPNLSINQANQLARSTSNKPPPIGILRNKQRSEELPDHHYHHARSSTGCHQRPGLGGGQNRAKSALGPLSGNQKLRVGNNAVVKVAWGDDDAVNLNDEVGGLEPPLVAKEVVLSKGVARGGSGRFGDGRFAASERERGLVLDSREQLAQRLRIAWQERDASKKNLNIILTPQITTDDSLEDDFIAPPNSPPPRTLLRKDDDDEECVTKIICSSKRNQSDLFGSLEKVAGDTQKNGIVDVTNIFRRTIPRRTLKYEQNNYEPSRNDGGSRRSSAILVVPSVENKSGQKDSLADDDSKIVLSNDKIADDSSEQVSGCPQHKRELLQKRSNATFNMTMDSAHDANNVHKPKLIRAVSTKYTTSSKFDKQPPNVVSNTIPKRRRIKSTTTLLLRRGNKYSTQTTKSFSTPSAVNHSDSLMGSLNSLGNHQQHNHVTDMPRHVYQRSKDIVTMVSLLSPNLTDNEDDVDNDDGDQQKVALIGADGNVNEKKVVVAKGQQHQFNSLRKTVKSVSFQQSSIHSVRSFCASFPGRRGSVGTSGSAYSIAVVHQQKKPANVLNASSILSGGNKLQEKRGSFSEGGNEDAAKPKRRLVRTVSDSNDGCYTSNMTSPSNKTKADQSQAIRNTADKHVSTSEEAVVQTVSDKEAYCMNTYRKLTESGINISLETILRGMLTPTEYRLRCKREAVEARQDGDEGGEESNMALSNYRIK